MKKLVPILLAIISFLSCTKEQQKNGQNDDDNLLTHKVTYSYVDTVTPKPIATKFALDGFSCTVTVNYIGNNNYSITVSDNVSFSAALTTYTLYKDGVPIETEDIDDFNNFTITRPLVPGTYYFSFKQIGAGETNSFQTQTFPILTEPVAPAGMICLFRYYDPTNGQHICTYDWQELGCAAKGFVFEKVLGYTYPSANSAPNLKPIYRYYKASDGSHFTTDLLGNYSGYVYEKILGYVGTAPTTTLSRSLTKYYNSTIDDHFVCVAPDVPKGTAYTQDIDFVFGYLQ